VDAKQYEDVIRFCATDAPWMNIMSYGHSGIGKTAIPKQIAAELGIPYIHLDATGMEPSDLIGLPFKEEMIAADGKTKEMVTRFLPPRFLKAMEQSPNGIFIMDEVTRLDLQVRNTWMQFLSEGTLGEVKRPLGTDEKSGKPTGWLVVQTANPADEGYQVTDLDIALVRRSIVLELGYDLEVWRDWAAGKYRSRGGQPISARVIAAAGRMNKGLVKPIKNKIMQTLTPDGLRVCSELVEVGIMDKMDRDTALAVLSGAAGSEAALAIYQSLNDKRLQELLDQAMKGEKVKFGGNDHDVAVDLLYVFWEKVAKNAKKYAKEITNLYHCLPEDIRIALIKACYSNFAKHREEFQELAKEWREWCTKNALAQGR